MYGKTVPAAPIAELLREALALRARNYVAHDDDGAEVEAGGARDMGADFAERFGYEPASGARAIHRLLAGQPTITVDAADRWATFLGSHLALVAPELYR